MGNLRTLPIINMKNIGSAYSSNCSDYKLLNFSTSGHFARIYAKYGWNFSHVQLFDCQNVDTSASVCFLASILKNLGAQSISNKTAL